MTSHRVVALVREAEDQARLRGALRGTGELVPCASTNEVLQHLASGAALAVVVTAYGPAVADAVGLTRALRVRHPTVPVLVYYDARWTNPRDLLALFHAGAAEIVQSDSEDLRRVFSSILAAAGHRVKAWSVLDQLRPIVPPKALPIIQYLLEEGDQPLSIDEAAQAVGLARRTLEKRLSSLGYPPPETLIGWCRLLMAARLLEDNGRTFDDVALALDFPSGMALRSMLKRYTGITGREARDGNGPVALILRHLTERLSTPEAANAVAKSRGGTHSTRGTVPGSRQAKPRRPPTS